MGIPQGYALLEETKGRSENALKCNLFAVTPVGNVGPYWKSPKITIKESKYGGVY